MTSRQVGSRISELSGGRRVQTGRTPERQKKMSPGEKRRLAQLTACCLIFVLLVAVKLLLPGKAAGLRESVSALMGQNMDVTEVFSAVGRAVSGKEDARETLSEVYRAVFRPEEGETLETAGAASVPAGNAAAEATASAANGNETAAPAEGASAASASAAQATASEAEAAPAVQTKNLAYILYSDQNLPENVSMQQALLDFPYCTPVKGTLSSAFGYREHPIEGEEKFHYGLDIAAGTGTEIDSFADGTVTAAGESTSYGKYLIIAHEGNYATLYAHCSAITVSSGAQVKMGEKVAEVGETGMATGPHLHFELHSGDTYLNPIYYVSVSRA